MAEDLLVACLCAEWCTTCREYRERLEQVRLGLPEVKFVWVDIEDEAELVSPIEVENFPTVLIAVGSEARYFGPLTPQRETLERLLRAVPGLPAIADIEIVELARRIRAALPRD
jgi:thiol-disulfide isomerase/thioredoxin